MKKLLLSLSLFGALFLSFVLSGCDFLSPPQGDTDTIENPPPADRFYVACRVDGRPVVFRSPRTSLHTSSRAYVMKDTLFLRIRSHCYWDPPKSRFVEISLGRDFAMYDNLFDTKKLGDYEAYWYDEKYNNYRLRGPRGIEGTVRITKIQFKKENELNPYVSGEFEFSFYYPYPRTKDSRKFEITDGVFNVPF